MNADNLEPKEPRRSELELETVRGELVGLRRRGLARAVPDGEYPTLIAIARERGQTGPVAWVLRELLQEAVRAIEAGDEYRKAISADYGLDENFGKPYRARRRAARKIFDEVSESVWEKTQPQMAATLADAVLRLRSKQASPLPDRAPRRWPSKPSLRRVLVALVLVGLMGAAVIVARASSGTSPVAHGSGSVIVDATTGRLLHGVAARSPVNPTSYGGYLLTSETTLCIGSAERHCEHQDSARFACREPHPVNAITGRCDEAAVDRTFPAHIGDLIRFTVPLASKTRHSLLYVELYLQHAWYVRPRNKLLIQITAQVPGPTYSGPTTESLPPPTPLCSPGGVETCLPSPAKASPATYEESLARLTLQLSANSESAQLNYLPGSLALRDPGGRLLVHPPGNILYTSGIAFANVEPKASRLLTFAVWIGSA